MTCFWYKETIISLTTDDTSPHVVSDNTTDVQSSLIKLLKNYSLGLLTTKLKQIMINETPSTLEFT